MCSEPIPHRAKGFVISHLHKDGNCVVNPQSKPTITLSKNYKDSLYVVNFYMFCLSNIFSAKYLTISGLC